MSLLGTFLSVLISPFGVLAFLIGAVSFMMLPVVPRLTNHFKSFARVHHYFAARMLKRAAIVLSEQGDLILKRMSPDDIGTETITFDKDTKEFGHLNEHHARSSWMGIPFALADEVHGFLFTPIEAALGARKAAAEKQDEMVVKATESERSLYDVQGWITGVFEFSRDTYELVDLNMVRQIVTGSERAEHPQRVKTFYELSREPYNDGASATDMILIVVAMVGPFAALWILSSQLGLSSVSGPSSTVGFGSLLYLLFSRGSITNINWGRVLAGIVVLVPLPAILALVAVFVSPVYAGALAVILLLGFIIPIFLIEILKISTGAANAIAGLLMKTGFFAYDRPVWEYTPQGYRIREFNKMDVDESKIVWHPFLGRTFGFTYTPTEDLWGDELVDADDLQSRAVDNSARQTNIPSGHKVIPEVTRAVYGEIIPSSIKSSNIYVKVGIALERMKNVATGHKSHERLTQSKDEHGGAGGLSDAGMMKAIVAVALISFLSGIGIFILPAFL